MIRRAFETLTDQQRAWFVATLCAIALLAMLSPALFGVGQ
jgi:hypothetical protein